jgi:hypothetical protein
MSLRIATMGLFLALAGCTGEGARDVRAEQVSSAACTPRTCADAFSCGAVDDGCGGVLDCCPGGQACPCAVSMDGFDFPAKQFPTCCGPGTPCVSTPGVCAWTPTAGCGATAFCETDPTHQLVCCGHAGKLVVRLCTGPGKCPFGTLDGGCLLWADCPAGSRSVKNGKVGGVPVYACKNDCDVVGPGGCAICDLAAYTSSCTLSWDGSACHAVVDDVDYCTTFTSAEADCEYSDPRFCKWMAAPCHG